MGRPTEYRPEYCEFLLTKMKEGFSLRSVAAELGFHHDTLYEWMKVQPDFADAYEKGKELQYHWWEKMGRNIALGIPPITLKDKDGKDVPLRHSNPTIFIWMTKNLLNWRDRQEINLSGKDGGPLEIKKMSDEELKARLKELAEKANAE